MTDAVCEFESIVGRMELLETWASEDDTHSDVEFLKRIFSKMLLSQEWRERLDAFSDGGLLLMLEVIGAEAMLPNHLEYITQRLCSSLVNSSRKKYRKQTVQVFVIYWLYMASSPDVPIYVGMTQNLSQRWAAHRIGRRHTRTVSEIADLRIKVVETVCGKEHDAEKAEARHIKAALALNPNLLNKRNT